MQRSTEHGRPFFGMAGEVRSKRDLTEPTLLEMSGKWTYQELSVNCLTVRMTNKAFSR